MTIPINLLLLTGSLSEWPTNQPYITIACPECLRVFP